MKKTTLQDISEFTGLSVSTVSRILRGESGLNNTNVKTTIDAAIKLNYPLNVGFLKGKYQFKTKTRIALVTTIFPSEFYAAFIAGLYDAADDTHTDLSVHHYAPEKTDLFEFIKSLLSRSIEGVILFLPELSESSYQQLVDKLPANFAFISILPIQNPAVDTITFDSYGGGYLIAQHFHQKGYLDVGIVNGPFNRQESLLRRNGFQDYIAKHNDMNLVWVYNGDFEYMDGFSAFSKYLSSPNKPRAIFCANDVMCVSFLSRATEHGVSIPNDLALAGFDDLPMCRYVNPAITSVKTDYSLLGSKALDILKAKLTQKDPHTGIQSLIPVSISKREST